MAQFTMWNLVLQALLASRVIAEDVLLPEPKGRYDVTIRTSELEDASRIETEDGQQKPRRLMVSAFSPTLPQTVSCTSPYMLDKVAARYHRVYSRFYNISVDFNRFTLPLCSRDVTHGLSDDHRKAEEVVKTDYKPTLPLVLFSPGLGATRFRYNAICASLASFGFLVLSIDHPHTVDIIQFPDNTTVTMANKIAYGIPSEQYLESHLQPRVKDASFILDSLTWNNTLSRLLFPTAKPNVKKVGVLGHSYGGAMAAQVISQDKRFAGGINLDGSMYGSVVHEGLSRPFILWQSEGHSRKTDKSWAQFYSKSSDFKRNLQLNGAAHSTFTDGPLLADLYPYDREAVGAGAVPGKRVLKILTFYARDFFNYALLGEPKRLVKGPNEKFPEVAFIP